VTTRPPVLQGQDLGQLAESFLPTVKEATDKLALSAQYNKLASKASQFGLAKGDELKIENYVTRKALDGLFLMIAEEEKAIRKDPGRRRRPGQEGLRRHRAVGQGSGGHGPACQRASTAPPARPGRRRLHGGVRPGPARPGHPGPGARLCRRAGRAAGRGGCPG
jgi:hypothetical protein